MEGVYRYKFYKELAKKEKEEIGNNEEKQKKVLDRIDLWATVLPTEYEMLKSFHPSIKADFFPFHYATYSITSSFDRVRWDDAKMMLIGNSGDPSNNHIDILRLLEERGVLRHYKAYVPIAYGGEQKYRKNLKAFVETNQLNCALQEDMMPYKDYEKTVMGCRVAVFGHSRQQAMGNIVLSLLQGRKVFLYKDSMVYRYCKSKGMVVYSIDDDLCLKEINTPLKEVEYYTNKKTLDEFAVEQIVAHVEASLDCFEHNHAIKYCD